MSDRLVELAAKHLDQLFPELDDDDRNAILGELSTAAARRAMDPTQPLKDALEQLWQAVGLLHAAIVRPPHSASDGERPRRGSTTVSNGRSLSDLLPVPVVTVASTAKAVPQQGSIVRLACDLLAKRFPDDAQRREDFYAAFVKDVLNRPFGRSELLEDELDELWEAIRVVAEVQLLAKTSTRTGELPRWLRAT